MIRDEELKRKSVRVILTEASRVEHTFSFHRMKSPPPAPIDVLEGVGSILPSGLLLRVAAQLTPPPPPPLPPVVLVTAGMLHEGIVHPAVRRIIFLSGRKSGKRCQWFKSFCSVASHLKADSNQRASWATHSEQGDPHAS